MIKRVLGMVGMILGACCFGLLFIAIFVNANEVHCGLAANSTYSCQTRTLLLGRVQTSARQYDNIVDVTMAESSCDDGCAYRAEFVTAGGEQFPVSVVYTDRGPVSRQIESLRSQMQRQENPIIYKVNPPWWALFLILGLTGMVILLSPLLLLRRG